MAEYGNSSAMRLGRAGFGARPLADVCPAPEKTGKDRNPLLLKAHRIHIIVIKISIVAKAYLLSFLGQYLCCFKTICV